MVSFLAIQAPGIGDSSGVQAADALVAVGASAWAGWAALQALLSRPLITVSGLDITPGGMLLAVLALLVVWLVSALLRRAIARYGARHEGVNPAALYTVSRLTHYALLTAGFLLALDLAGIPIAKFAIFAGALGVGLGFGLQAIFSNFVSGLILLFDRSLKVGDFVQLDDNLRGTVRAINIRATLITTNDDIDVIVPNSEFVSGRVINWTHGSMHRRIRVRFGVAYGTDKELVKKAALEAAAQVPFTLATEGDKRPQVWLVNFGDSAVEFVLAVWLNDTAARRNAAIEAAYLWELDTALKRNGIEIPFPQRDLHVRSLFGLDGAQAMSALHGGRVDMPDASAPGLRPYERAALSRNDASGEAARGVDDDERDVPPDRDHER